VYTGAMVQCVAEVGLKLLVKQLVPPAELCARFAEDSPPDENTPPVLVP